jgi:hypothetical protein
MTHCGCKANGGSPGHSELGPDDDDKQTKRKREVSQTSQVVGSETTKEFPWFRVGTGALLIILLLVLLFMLAPDWVASLCKNPAATS